MAAVTATVAGSVWFFFFWTVSRPVPAHVGPCWEPMSDGGPAGVVGLGVPEAGGDGLGRLAVTIGQFQGVAELRGGGQ